MRLRALQVLTAASAGILLATVPVLAHHWFPVAGTDPPIAFSGKVTRVQWVNPHVHFYLDMKSPVDGKTEIWEIELGSPSALTNRGWKRDDVKEGQVLNIEGFVFKDGTKRAVARTIKLPDGRSLLAGSHAGDQLTPITGDKAKK